MKIALAQINPIVGDFKGARSKIQEFAQKAKNLSCDLVIFPELSVCGYPPRDLLERKSFIRACQNTVQSLLDDIHDIGVILGFVDRVGGAPGKPIANAAMLFEDGNILEVVHKRLLPTYDVFDESRYFAPGGKAEPFMYKGMNIGLTICEDAWNDKDLFPEQLYDWDPVQDLADKKTDLIINIAASPFHAGKRAVRGNIMSHLAKKHRLSCVYVNQVGGNDHLIFDGASTVHTPGGDLAALAGEFEEDLVTFDTETGKGDIHPVCESEAESLAKALVTGVGDYVRKCGFSKVVVGLSGGIDSALTLAVAAEALGPENTYSIFMPSEYTSQQNYTDTKELADNLGCPYEIIPITPIFETFLSSLSFCNKEDFGVTEQNIQARTRGSILMAFSNKTGAMVLSTGNKSEVAVGYCTLYGDMNGGLSVISDLPKELVYEVSRYFNKDREIIPESILTKAPSAELRPDQTDQDDLPPYEVLDPILHAYIEDLKDPEEIIAMGYEEKIVRDIVRRVVRNEYKRRQAAPGLKLTSKAFGEGRRYPVAQRFKDQDGE
ncbi:NAD+ synthase [Desulfatibacillum aliphaticivorans]|uniref:NAD+ synthase n=1 Tax=Desulfatibacillum aliphaticivorans TaxID=218208 RepID=UPI00041FAFE0|nr:NAD+ synthase [Desulfatibacillum aliphaticivorans]